MQSHTFFITFDDIIRFLIRTSDLFNTEGTNMCGTAHVLEYLTSTSSMLQFGRFISLTQRRSQKFLARRISKILYGIILECRGFNFGILHKKL